MSTHYVHYLLGSFFLPETQVSQSYLFTIASEFNPGKNLLIEKGDSCLVVHTAWYLCRRMKIALCLVFCQTLCRVLLSTGRWHMFFATVYLF